MTDLPQIGSTTEFIFFEEIG